MYTDIYTDSTGPGVVQTVCASSSSATRLCCSSSLMARMATTRKREFKPQILEVFKPALVFVVLLLASKPEAAQRTIHIIWSHLACQRDVTCGVGGRVAFRATLSRKLFTTPVSKIAPPVVDTSTVLWLAWRAHIRRLSARLLLQDGSCNFSSRPRGRKYDACQQNCSSRGG